jgi:hypothetical protein
MSWISTITITYHPGLVQQDSSGRSTQSPTAQIKKKVYNLNLMLDLSGRYSAIFN